MIPKILKELEQGNWVIPILAKTFVSEISTFIEKLHDKIGSTRDIPFGMLAPMAYLKFENKELEIFLTQKEEFKRVSFLGKNQNELKLNDFARRFSPTCQVDQFQESKMTFSLKMRDEMSNSFPAAFESLGAIDLKFLPVRGAAFRAASHPHLIGTIALGEGYFKLGPLEAQKSIAHELAHQELFLINLVDRIVLPGREAGLDYSPLQKTERPLIGRFHSAHALFRMIQFERLNSMASIEATTELLRKTLEKITLADLTPFGSDMVTNVFSKIF